MLFNSGLETLILERHTHFRADELVVLSGYVGPSPIQRICTLPIRTTVIYGMYGIDRIRRNLHNSLVAICSTSDRLRIFYSRVPVHSKCYLWKNSGAVVHALVGSANFTSNGIRTPFREILAETSMDTFEPLSHYIDEIIGNSVPCLSNQVAFREAGPAPTPEAPNVPGTVCRMTLLDPTTGETHNVSGLNWGQGVVAHTNPNDASIPIRAAHVRSHPDLFPEKQVITTAANGRGRPHRNNDAIELIWDDGTTMDGLLEGNLEMDGRTYPKQISSFPCKTDLGIYFRRRLGVPLGARVTRRHLEQYGRTDIDLSLISEGVYNCDFSV